MNFRWIRHAPEAALVAGLLVFGVALTGAVQAADTLTPSAVVTGASTYDGQSITVAGTVENLTTHQTRRGGTMTRYQLCDTSCINVIDFSVPSIKEGDKYSATGNFSATLKPFHARSGGSHFGFGSGSGSGSSAPQTNVLMVRPATDSSQP